MKKSNDVQITVVKFKDFQVEKLKVMLYATRCSMQRMQINNQNYIKTLINSKVKINVIFETLALET